MTWERKMCAQVAGAWQGWSMIQVKVGVSEHRRWLC